MKLKAATLFLTATFFGAMAVYHTHVTRSSASLASNAESDACARELQELTVGLPAVAFAPSESPADIANRLFQQRVVVAKKLRELNRYQALSTSCLQAHREYIRSARLIEDSYGEMSAGFPDYAETAQPFRGNAPALLVNPDFMTTTQRDGFSDFKSGDVLIARGKTFTGAAIGRMSDNDSTFSHMGLIYIDESTREFYTIESFMEKGVQVYARQKFETPDKARMALYRYRDSAVAADAARFIFEEVSRRNSANRNFAYDFRLNPSNRDSLYCSEVIQHAFETATGKKFDSSLESTFSTTNRDFFNRFEMVGRKAYLPTDIEIDPAFELVAEWRDFARTNDARMKDAVLSAAFNWMDRYGYKIYEPTGIRVKSFAANNLRNWPVFSEYLKTRVPRGIPNSALGAYLTLHDVSVNIYMELLAENNRYKSANGLWMTDSQMMAFLERLRETDLASYRARRPVVFHHLLR